MIITNMGFVTGIGIHHISPLILARSRQIYESTNTENIDRPAY